MNMYFLYAIQHQFLLLLCSSTSPTNTIDACDGVTNFSKYKTNFSMIKRPFAVLFFYLYLIPLPLTLPMNIRFKYTQRHSTTFAYNHRLVPTRKNILRGFIVFFFHSFFQVILIQLQISQF